MKNIIRLINRNNKFLSGSIYSILLKVLTIFLSLVSTIIIARNFETKIFGQFSYSMGVYSLTLMFVNLGLDQYTIKHFIKKKSFKVIMDALFLRSFVSFAIFLIYFFNYLVEIKTNNEALLFIIIISNLLFYPLITYDLYFQSKQKFKEMFWIYFISLLLGFCLKLISVYIYHNIIYFAYSMLIESMILSIIKTYFINKNKLVVFYFKKNIYTLFNIKKYKYLISNSLNLFLSSIFIAIYMKIDLIIIKILLGTEAVAKYSVVTKISEIWSFLPVALIMVAFPKMVENYKFNIKKYDKYYEFLTILFFLISVTIIFTINLFAKNIIIILYGNNFLESVAPLKIHIFSLVFIFIGTLFNRSLILKNKTKEILLATINGAISNILLNIILIPIFGIMGAAISTVISYSIAALFSFYFYKKTKAEFLNQINKLSFRNIFNFLKLRYEK